MDEALRLYYEVVPKIVKGWPAPALRHGNDFLFRGVSLRGRRVLDIGGGSGLTSFYAHACGASRVVCLEPEASGSTAGVTSQFRELAERLGAPNAEILGQTFQEFSAEDGSFDVIILNQSVNHLDESACIKLRNDPAAADVYRVLFARMARMSSTGADIVICDCSSRSFFAALRVKNPFAPQIEWFKHQPPGAWAALLGEAGYERPVVTWLWYRKLGWFGRIFCGNAAGALFYNSKFCLRMRKRS